MIILNQKLSCKMNLQTFLIDGYNYLKKKNITNGLGIEKKNNQNIRDFVILY